MAYWYTYPISPSSSSESEEEIDARSDKELQDLFDTERDFYEDIGNHPQFYAFHTKDYIAWNMQLYRPIYRNNPLCHFARYSRFFKLCILFVKGAHLDYYNIIIYLVEMSI